MISFRQEILPMISEKEPDFLKCKVCHKEFPRFDQRGFRNAGFTAHQNRCVEREHLLSLPASDQQSSPRQRFLLPAPPTSVPSSSSSNSKLLIVSSNSSSPIIRQQQQQKYQPYFHSLQIPIENPQSLSRESFSHSPQVAGIHYIPEETHQYAHSIYVSGQASKQQSQSKADFSLFNCVGESRIQQQLPVIPVSSHEMLFPVTLCNHCDPEHGLHQPSCLFLAEFLHRSGST